MKAKTEHKSCFYCGCLVTGNCEMDHFPVPECFGGTLTVPSCISCHDMKDRFNPGDWPEEWVQKIIADFRHLNRETRIFLALALRAMADATSVINNGAGQNGNQP